MENNKEEIQCCVTQCDVPLDKNFWETRWENSETAWDIGYATPAIVEFMEKVTDKNVVILIPGCGNAYEAEFLLNNGFTNITLIDIAPKAVEILKNKFKNNSEIKVLCEDFFQHQGHYDVMIEQTFFCAIPPFMRTNYAEKAHQLLNEKGKIIGLIFDAVFEKQGPPFGGCPCEYKPIFEALFEIKTMEECRNSIAPRQGKELFIELIKK